MPNIERFASLTASLRAPRVAILIPAEAWETHSARAIESLSRIWGGAAGVVVPVKRGQLSPAVQRLFRLYDPDYVTTLQLSLGEMEELTPGAVPVTVDGKRLSAGARKQHLAKVEADGPQLIGQAIEDEVASSIAAALQAFREDDGVSRVRAVHPSAEPGQPLSTATPEPAQQVLLLSGDPVIDVALALRNGRPSSPTEVRQFADGSLGFQEASAVLTADSAFEIGTPFGPTREGLSWISYGMPVREGPLVVLGRTADDMALAMLWDRLTGAGIWMPFNGSHRRWHPWIGSALDLARINRMLTVTSASWDEGRCEAFMRRVWDARIFKDPSDTAEPWEFLPPTELEAAGRVDLRLNERWDERFAVPVDVSEDGSADMVTTFPLVASESFPEGHRGWIVDAEWPSHPVHNHPAVQASDLLAEGQNEHETFVRVSGRSISFESGRFDFVLSGASKFGQLAQPRLRWPGLLTTLRIAAASNSYSVRPSQAGRVGRIAAGLWNGRADLADDLASDGRVLIDAFNGVRKGNGPIDKGATVTPSNRRLQIAGSCLVPFEALERLAGTTTSRAEIREWLDKRLETGAVRRGLALECKICPWLDFYRIDEVGTHFTCKRCGSENVLSQERWRDPIDDPRWYYSLHPTMVQFLDGNGDVPLLAVRQFSTYLRAFGAEFELEIVKDGASRPTMEIDFAFMTRAGLVIGEAKSVSKLDGNDEKQRMRDVGKLIDGARILGAREICFASSKTWGPLARTAIDSAITASGTSVTVSILERLGTSAPARRQVIHNVAGP